MTLPREKVDVVIVGSGAAGAHFAARLSQAGQRVAVLEAGPEIKTEQMVSSMLWARRLKWKGAPVLETGPEPVGYVFNAGWGVGGASVHHYAVWPRMHENDFRVRSLYGRGLDWPISYADLRPYYDRVQKECGISGDAKAEAWRPAGEPYPMGPVASANQGRIVGKGFESLGMKVAPLPMAIATRTYDGRPSCIWDGWCDAGCPTGALSNALSVHWPKALAAGATLHPNTQVVRVLTESKGNRASGVEVVTANGERVRIMADAVVLAANTIQNARILLASESSHHPHGLGNASGTLGQFVTSHLAAPIFGLHPDKTNPWFGAFGGQFLNQEHYDQKEKFSGQGAFGSYQWMIAQAVKPNGLLGIAPSRPDIRGAALKRFMERSTEHMITMTGVVEDLPIAENRVTLSQQKDAWGVPLATVQHASSPESLALWKVAVDEGLRVFRAAGADDVWNAPKAPMHIMGGTIMGKEAGDSVANRYGAVHEVPNLVLGGASLFPTSGGVNPTFTIHALASMACDQLT